MRAWSLATPEAYKLHPLASACIVACLYKQSVSCTVGFLAFVGRVGCDRHPAARHVRILYCPAWIKQDESLCCMSQPTALLGFSTVKQTAGTFHYESYMRAKSLMLDSCKARAVTSSKWQKAKGPAGLCARVVPLLMIDWFISSRGFHQMSECSVRSQF